MRKTIIVLIILLFSGYAYGADTKGSALTPFTPVDSDILVGVDDPGGTPVSGSVSISALSTKIEADFATTYQAYDANMITWPASVDATEVGYLDGVTASFGASAFLGATQGVADNVVTWLGVCSDGAYTTQATCEGAAETWTVYINGAAANSSILDTADHYTTDTIEAALAQNAADDATHEASTTAHSIGTKYISGTEADWHGTILNPQNVYANDATNHAFTIINDVPAAFTITEISISCDADPTTELTVTFQHKAAGVGYGTPTTIEAVATTAGTATIPSGIDDATIPAGVKVFATLSDPDDALLECAWQIEGDWD